MITEQRERKERIKVTDSKLYAEPPRQVQQVGQGGLLNSSSFVIRMMMGEKLRSGLGPGKRAHVIPRHL